MLQISFALLLVVVAMATAEPPRPRPVLLSRQSAPPYNQRGWRPNGPSFGLPQRQQAAGAQAPAPSYGPPPDAPQDGFTDYPATTESITENPVNQFLVEAETLELDPKEDKPKPKKSGKNEEPPKSPLLFFVPQKENLVYAALPQSAPLVAVPQPSFAKLQAVPAALQVLPYSSAVSTSVYTPYSSSYVQIYQ